MVKTRFCNKPYARNLYKMKIKSYQVIQFEFELRIDGVVVEQTPVGKPKTILTHNAPDLPKGLEAALIGKQPGQYSATVLPGEAYGEYDPELRVEVGVADLPEPPRIGGGFAGENDLLYRVVELKGDTAVLDANLEWAGKTLDYRFKILNIRLAESGEIEHGHVHGEGGIEH